jgi:hypothetical protein
MNRSRSFFLWAAFLLPAASRAQSPAQVPVGELFASDNATPGSVQPVSQGMSVVTGSELSAGVAPARLRLYRGGQLRLCPKSNLSITSGSQNGMMFAMGSGTLEVDYRLNPRVADLLITPDFSINMVGPGVFHAAIGVNKKGDTCVKPLPGNTAELSFSELLGSTIYKVKANETVVFQGGKLSARGDLKEDCGCPPAPPMMHASGTPPTGQPLPGTPVANPAMPMPQEKPGQVQVEVDTPFVFNAGARGPVKPYSVAKVKFSALPNVNFLPDKVNPVVQSQPQVPAATHSAKETAKPEISQEPKEKKGFLGKIGSFFHSLFRGAKW